ncbi:dethiobiotin synthase [Methylophaga marina]|uniref:ATP-dependent dethiobiotin synthetase BioD n=1 Tax=Methylophaga marina TaxID=45495 RepID=A0ABP3D8M8_9GAMM
MTSTHFFITGTDTEVGKTFISVGLVSLLQQQGYKTVGMKPIASGCEWLDGQWKNEDALALIKQSQTDLDYSLINPYAFEPAIAPHIAAEREGVTLSLANIKSNYDLIAEQADAVIVEGAGGWYVPLNAESTMADLAVKLQLPVILVVAIKLGCINHALLTVAAIEQHGLKLAGWVANHVAEQSESTEMIETLTSRIDAPCLGVVPHLNDHQSAASFLRLPE